MSENVRVLTAVALGAVVGGVAGFLYLTENGRRFRDRVDPWLDDFLAETRRAQQTAEKVRGSATEAWQSLQGVVGR